MKDKRFVSAGRMGECFKVPSPLFRPIVASSLVLALSASAINAQTCTDVDPADKPIFCYADGGSASPHTITADKDSRNIGDRGRTAEVTKTIYKGDVTLKGNIWVHEGERQTIFEGNATIRAGNEVIYAGHYENRHGYHGRNTIVFKGENNIIENTTSNDLSKHIAIQANGNNGSTDINTYNYLTFERGNNTIKGKIYAATNYNNDNRSAANYLVFKSGTATIDGQIETFRGKNKIYLGDSTIAYLLKDITARGENGQNIIQSKGELIIQSTSAQQTISATYGQNTITAQTITLGSSDHKLNLTVNGNNATSDAKNSITSTEKMMAHFGEVKAHENGTGNGKRTNEIIGGSGSEIYIESLSASGANNSNHVTVSKDGSLTIKTITSSGGGQNNITIGENSRATIINSVNSNGGGSDHFVLQGDGAYLTFQGGNTNKISSLISSGKTLVDLAGIEDGRPKENIAATNTGTGSNIRKTLEIGTTGGSSNGNPGFKGEAAFEVYVGGGKNDTVTFKSASKQDGSSANSVATIVASGDIHTILNGDGTTHKLATVENGAKDNMEVKGGERLIGGVIVETVLTPKNGSNGGNGNEEYYLGKGIDKGTPVQYQEVARSALMTGYDLYLANFNSINKRMGELRDNPYSQGVWARVFGGSTSSDFGSGSTTDYVTLQAGYDYSLSFNNAKNYMGIALAYAKSWTKGNALSMNGLIGASETISLSNVDSDMVEVGIYNSYVADNGWYNDTILKFDYIMSKFALSNRSDFYTDTDNFAIVLSDEFGYRYKFGDDESWYIDPQAEVALGYFNQTDFNRAMQDASGLSSTTLNAKQENILTLRGRAGMSLGKRFTTDQGFVSLYVGTFYEYDYIYGGNASLVGREGGKSISLDGLESNGRIIVNTGSNIALTESTRLYIDVEKSFGDKQRTHMQFNFGARYSF